MYLTDRCFAWIGELRPTIRRLKANYCYLITDFGIRALGVLTELEAISLGKCSIGDESCGCLGTFKSLQALELSGCGTITDNAILS